MSASVEVSEIVERSVSDTFRIFAIEHVRNHPRWDPNMQLEQLSDDPIGVGTIIKRINSRSGEPVEGTMEVVEFELNQTLGMVIHDGPVEMNSRGTFEAQGDDRTELTFHIEIPGMDETTDTSQFEDQMKQALLNIKQFIESEA
jgi:hypothetical protein